MAPKKVLTRQELYDLVWADPIRTVATTYGVSDVWLKKVCVQAAVPTPDLGRTVAVRGCFKQPSNGRRSGKRAGHPLGLLKG